MSEHVYKYVELTGSSTVGIEDAVAKALERARQTLRNIRWFVISEIRGQIDEGQVNHWQVTIKLGFTLEE